MKTKIKQIDKIDLIKFDSNGSDYIRFSKDCWMYRDSDGKCDNLDEIETELFELIYQNKISYKNDNQYGRYRIKISEIISLRNRLKEINSQPLDTIDFLDDEGNMIDIHKDIVDDFAYTGCNNTDFIITGFYKTGFNS